MAAALRRGGCRLAIGAAAATAAAAAPAAASWRDGGDADQRWARPWRARRARAAGCQAAGLRSSTSNREHSFIHQADFTPRMAEIASGVDFRTMLAEGCFLLEGVDFNIIERLVFGDTVFATRGTRLIEKGSENSDIFIVGHGSLSVMVGDVQVASVGPGQVIGLYTLLKKTQASADVTVGSDLAYVLVLRHHHFMGCLDDCPEVLERMKMLLRQREMQNKAAEMVSGT